MLTFLNNEKLSLYSHKRGTSFPLFHYWFLWISFLGRYYGGLNRWSVWVQTSTRTTLYPCGGLYSALHWGLQAGARPKYHLQGMSALWFSLRLFMVFASIIYSIFPDASCMETDVEVFKRPPEQSLKFCARKMAGNGSSSTTVVVDEVGSRRSWQ